MFVRERLIASNGDEPHKKLRDTLHKNKPLTFSSLRVAAEKGNEKSANIKIDRSILQRIITAYDSGRRVDLRQILRHELVQVPLAIADNNGKLRTGNKSIIVDVLSNKMTNEW